MQTCDPTGKLPMSRIAGFTLRISPSLIPYLILVFIGFSGFEISHLAHFASGLQSTELDAAEGALDRNWSGFEPTSFGWRTKFPHAESAMGARNNEVRASS
jgi:hypothetical protein